MKHEIKAVMGNNLFMLNIITRHTPALLFSALFNGVFFSISWFVEHVLGIMFIMDIVENGGAFIHVVYWILVMFCFTAVLHLSDAFYDENIFPRHSAILTVRIMEAFYQKAQEIDIACYDDPDFYNEFVWSMNEAPSRALKIIEQMRWFVNSLSAVLLSSAFFLTFDRVGLAFVIISFTGSFFVNLSLNKRRFLMNRSVRFKERKRSYFHRVFYLKDYAGEIRLNDVSGKLKNGFTEVNEEIREEVDKHSKSIVLMSFLSKYIFNDFFFNGLYIMYLVYSIVIAHTMGLGSFLALYRLSTRMNSALQRIAKDVPVFQENSMYIEKMRGFLKLKPGITDVENPISVPFSWQVLEFRDVCFGYGENAVLKKISLRIKNGDKTAIVGCNGAGKTTLIKLIMRLYDVTSGEILLDGKDIRLYKLADYRALFSSTFQNYQIYAARLDENVVMDECGDNSHPKVMESLRLADFSEKLRELPLGLLTAITSEFDEEGVGLSGGEAQKVAIARTFYKESPFVILDEPSSALDPISEYNLYNSMLKSAEDKTMVFVSHRLSSTLMADTIILLKDGEIAESGSHSELMRNNGDYARMFRVQAEYYSYQA